MPLECNLHEGSNLPQTREQNHLLRPGQTQTHFLTFIHYWPRIFADSTDAHGFDPQKSVESGFIDETGKVVIKPAFEASNNVGHEFHDGLMEIGGSEGTYVDRTATYERIDSGPALW
jgi:hypothetical protein